MVRGSGLGRGLLEIPHGEKGDAPNKDSRPEDEWPDRQAIGTRNLFGHTEERRKNAPEND